MFPTLVKNVSYSGMLLCFWNPYKIIILAIEYSGYKIIGWNQGFQFQDSDVSFLNYGRSSVRRTLKLNDLDRASAAWRKNSKSGPLSSNCRYHRHKSTSIFMNLDNCKRFPWEVSVMKTVITKFRRTKFSADKIFRWTNFSAPSRNSAVLSDEFFHQFLRGRSFLSPDTRLECFLRGAKFLAKNLRGARFLAKNLSGEKFLAKNLRVQNFQRKI